MEVKLINGEMVEVEERAAAMVGGIKTFIRIGPELIAGIANSDDESGIYIWQKIKGVYWYVGDFGFKVENGKMLLRVHTVIEGESAKADALQLLLKQFHLMEKTGFPIGVSLVADRRIRAQTENKVRIFLVPVQGNT